MRTKVTNFEYFFYLHLWSFFNLMFKIAVYKSYPKVKYSINSKGLKRGRVATPIIIEIALKRNTL